MGLGFARLYKPSRGGGGGGAWGSITGTLSAQTDLQNALNAKQKALPVPSTTQFVYVATWGNDANTGGPSSPFLTVGAAVASITDASAAKPYTIIIAPGSYQSEPDAIFAPHVYFYALNTGQSERELVHLQSLSGNPFTFSGLVSSVRDLFGASGICFDSWINFSALANTQLLVGIFTKCTFTNGIRNNNHGVGAAISFEFYSCALEGDLDNNNGYVYSENSPIVNGNINLYIYDGFQTIAGNGTLFTFLGSHAPDGNLLIVDNTTLGASKQVYIFSSIISSWSLISGGGVTQPAAVFTDAISRPNGPGVGAQWGITNYTFADSITYSAATPANWPSPSPLTVDAALNALAANGPKGLLLFNHYADVGNGGTAETTLYSDNIAGGQLAINGQSIVARYSLDLVSSATATRQVRVYFGGTAIFDSGAISFTASGDMVIEVRIVRDSSTTVRYSISASTTGASLGAYVAVGKLTGLTLGGANILKLTGQAAGTGAASNDIVAILGNVKFDPAA